MATKARTTRTPEEIRDEARAELPGLVAASRRLRALSREIEKTPEYRRRLALVDRENEERPPAALFELNRVFGLAGALTSDLVEGETDLEQFISNLDRCTEIKAWRDDPRRSKAAHARQRREWAADRKREDLERAKNEKVAADLTADAERAYGAVEKLAHLVVAGKADPKRVARMLRLFVRMHRAEVAHTLSQAKGAAR